MKMIFLVLVVLTVALSSHAGGVPWSEAVETLGQINYDTDWVGTNKSKQKCKISYDISAEGNSWIEISYFSVADGQFIITSMASLPDDALFLYEKDSKGKRHKFTQLSTRTDRKQIVLQIRYLPDFKALVELKRSPKDPGASCTVEVYH